ncbi:MAG: NUDIX hydrolase [Deltaproteobacteria bacterium HGW-Deltaproteobacteria-12]|nr:MAG: NUDIX hydrolase [Deltaproteobacteria bacterium HGW-Deltaproteobacteria-12]
MPTATSATVVNVRDAATVILVRTINDDSWELFLARRHRRQSFMAGAFVFPGGQLEESDCQPECSSLISQADSLHPQDLLQDKSLSPDRARGFFIAAIRETFEEAGIILAGDNSGNFITFQQKETLVRFAAHRRALSTGEISFAEILRQEKILLFPHALIPFSHWITPEGEKKRFDTRFFLAALPRGQETVSDNTELTEFLWATPQNALRMHFSREIILMPPTLKTVLELAQFATVERLFAAAKKRLLYPILPQIFEQGVKLPHDPEYGLDGYRRPANPEEPCRIIAEDGVWQAAFYKDKKSCEKQG